MKEPKNINIGQFTDRYEVPSVLSKEEAWKRLEQKMVANKVEVEKQKTIVVDWKIISVISAAAAIALIFWFVGFEKDLPTATAPSVAIVSAPVDVQSGWLPDSSSVQLNKNSKAEYSYNKTTGERKVSLKGEAMFDVVKGNNFIVSFDGGEVKVTGTSFYVSAYSADYLQVDCSNGSVEVTFANQLYKLSRGKGVRMYKGNVTGPYTCYESDVRDRLKGVYYWDKISLPEIVDLIGYRFGYQTKIDPILQKRKFSGKLELNSAKQVLTVVSVAMNLNYSIDEEKKTISVNAK
ncbi:MAG TPA: FecR domain-containing protein [Prolixibacteraceae bacterium]|nr:FecR domain-containing protein [Prolixibacteraceae bacterium]HPS12015.1 FecR domain-containing protein [Prolixibacteraceae bacterium]